MIAFASSTGINFKELSVLRPYMVVEQAYWYSSIARRPLSALCQLECRSLETPLSTQCRPTSDTVVLPTVHTIHDSRNFRFIPIETRRVGEVEMCPVTRRGPRMVMGTPSVLVIGRVLPVCLTAD